MRDQPVRDQHAVAAEVEALGTHVGGRRFFRERDQLRHRKFELRREHVVGVVPETIVPQSNVRGFVQNRFTVAAESLHPYVPDAGGRQCLFERVAVELRQAARHGECPNINQRFNLVRVEDADQLVERTGGMSDGVESCQTIFDA